jgi:hypothetical protein
MSAQDRNVKVVNGWERWVSSAHITDANGIIHQFDNQGEVEAYVAEHPDQEFMLVEGTGKEFLVQGTDIVGDYHPPFVCGRVMFSSKQRKVVNL